MWPAVLLRAASIWLYTNVFPHTLTGGQDNTSVEVSEEAKLCVCVFGSGGGAAFLFPLEVLDLYPSTAAG